MNHTPQIKKAIRFAAKKHHGQLRVHAESMPYITHLFSVALLVAESGVSDAVVAAALLHDTLEDTPTTREELAQEFGGRVAELVAHVSEEKANGRSALGWRERKEGYLAHLTEAPEDALVIAIADKIDNIEDSLAELAQAGPDFFKKMGHAGAEYAWYHGEVVRIARERLPERPLTKRLAEVYERERGALGGL